MNFNYLFLCVCNAVYLTKGLHRVHREKMTRKMKVKSVIEPTTVRQSVVSNYQLRISYS